MKSLFVFDPHDLESSIPGGVQICSQQFLKIVQAASTEVRMQSVSIDRSWSTRAVRKLHLGSYHWYSARTFTEELTKLPRGWVPDAVFLNRSETMRLANPIKERFPRARLVLMSHGNQSGDDLYEIAGSGGRRTGGFQKTLAVWKLGMDLTAESQFRHQFVDCVCVMSGEEQILENWLGAKSTFVIPRLISPSPLPSSVNPGRVGFVGTLDHTPNKVALRQVCEALNSHEDISIQLRLVGRPATEGEALAHKFPFVEYLGGLSDNDLKNEAASWEWFANPIFWLSRGASMKLGQALSWQLPVITTSFGMRGYQFDDECVVKTANEPNAFAQSILDCLANEPLRNNIVTRMRSGKLGAPTAADLGNQLKIHLRDLPRLEDTP